MYCQTIGLNHAGLALIVATWTTLLAVAIVISPHAMSVRIASASGNLSKRLFLAVCVGYGMNMRQGRRCAQG